MWPPYKSDEWKPAKLLIYYVVFWGVLINVLQVLIHLLIVLIGYVACSEACGDILERFFAFVPNRLIVGLVVGGSIGILVGLFDLIKRSKK